MKDITLTSKQICELVEALGFYGNPDTYWGIGIFPDRPCGEFADDWSIDEDGKARPGKLAREVLFKLEKEINSYPPPPHTMYLP